MAESLPGRWVPTFAADIQPGDTIRKMGRSGRVIGRARTPVTQPTFRLTYEDGTAESVEKTTPVQIWDTDGTVAARVVSMSAAAVGGNSGSQGLAGGFVEPGR